MVEYISNERDKAPYFWLWLIFFLFTALAAVLVQMVLLPHVFPAWHGGNGLLVGGDWLSFHQIAVDLAEEIKTTGWGAWELRPQGQAPAGIAAAIYALTVPQPWTMIPFNAFLHASATLVLLKIIQRYIKRWKTAILCVLPFLLFPSAMTWYTQIHKDGLFILGCLCFLYGLILLAGDPEWKFDIMQAVKSIVLIIVGATLVWMVRPYGTQMLLGTAVCVSILIIIIIIRKLRQGQINISNAVSIVASFFVIIFVLIPFTGSGIAIQTPTSPQNIISDESALGKSHNVLQTKTSSPEPIIDNSIEQNNNVLQISKSSELGSPMLNDEKKGIKSKIGLCINRFGSRAMKLVCYPFQYTNHVAYSIGTIRDGFRFGYPGAGSNIDCDVGLYDIKDIVCYLPRAVEISFLAPFPTQWFDQGTLASNTAMRRVSALEMSLVYICLALLPYSLWRWRKRVEMWIIMIFCTGMMLGFTLVVPNVGTLYRDRYAFIMTIVSVGIAGGVLLVEQIKIKRSLERPNKDLNRSILE